LTDVISYRTEKGDELKKLSKKKNISLSQLTSDIIDEYLLFYSMNQHYDMLRESKKVVSFCFEFLSESDIEKVSDLNAEEATQSMKMVLHEYSFENITDLLRAWFKYNKFTVEEFEMDGNLKFACKNNMSKNWNIEVSSSITKTYKNFGYASVIESQEKGLFSFKISKQKTLD